MFFKNHDVPSCHRRHGLHDDSITTARGDGITCARVCLPRLDERDVNAYLFRRSFSREGVFRSAFLAVLRSDTVNGRNRHCKCIISCGNYETNDITHEAML